MKNIISKEPYPFIIPYSKANDFINEFNKNVIISKSFLKECEKIKFECFFIDDINLK